MLGSFRIWTEVYRPYQNKNISINLKEYENCNLVLDSEVDYVFNMACNMGGMGFIENNKAECMLSVLIKTTY